MRIEAKPRAKNGQPHHSTAGIASASFSHCCASGDRRGSRFKLEKVLAHVERHERER